MLKIQSIICLIKLNKSVGCDGSMKQKTMAILHLNRSSRELASSTFNGEINQ
jgi:hypothetical protein